MEFTHRHSLGSFVGFGTQIVGTKPVITILGDNPFIQDVGGVPYVDAGATASDVEDGVLTGSIIATGTVDVDTAGTYFTTYSVTDADGNTAIKTRVISITEVIDTTPPVITLLGSATVNIDNGTPYVDEGATAFDDTDGVITGNITVSNPVNIDLDGSYTVTYNVDDAAGNSATEVTRTVVVSTAADVTAPVITLLGSTAVTIAVGDTYIDAGATALDETDGDITADIVTVNPVDVNTEAIYTITYNVSDAGGNPAVEVTRTVTVEAVSLATALINYANDLNIFQYSTNISGDTTLANQGTGDDGLLNTGRAIELVNGVNDVDIPIHHTLGAEVVANGAFDTDISSWADAYGNGGLTWLSGKLKNETIVVNQALARQFISTVVGKTYMLSADIDATNASNFNNISGKVAIFQKLTINVSNNAPNQTYTGTFTATSTSHILDLGCGSSTVGHYILFDNVSVKEITNPNSFLTHFDFATKQFVQNSSLLGATHNLTDITTNAILTHKTAFDAQSLANLNANPQLIAELGINGSSSELNVTLDATDSFYACSEESGGNLVDQRSKEDVVLYTFDTDMDGFSDFYGNGDVFWSGGKLNLTYNSRNALARKTDVLAEANSTYIIICDVDTSSTTANTAIDFKFGATRPNWGEDDFAGYIKGGLNKTVVGVLTLGIVASHYLQYNDITPTSSVGDGNNVTIDNIQIYKIETQDITNYAETVRTNVIQNTAGLQTTCLELDGAGVPIAYDLTKLHMYSDGFIDTQWTWTTGNTITENTVEYATTTKTMPYQIDDLSADGTTAITTITDFKVEE